MSLSAARRRSLGLCALSTLIFGVLCHGYRYLNAAFSGDGTLISQKGEEAYQISLGRFLQPVWWRVRGPVVAPFLIGLFTLLFLALTAYVLADVLRFARPWQTVLLCGLLTASETLGLAGATYLPWLDVYAAALFLAVMGARFCLAGGRRMLLAPLLWFCSLGLYQSYLTCAASTVVLALLADAASGRRSVKEVWKTGLCAVFLLFASLVLYALALRAVLSLFAVEASTEYNGVGRVGLVSPAEFLRLLAEAYQTPLRFLFSPADRAILPWHISRIPVPLNWLCALTALILLFAVLRPKGSALFTCVFLMLAGPLAANFVMIISQGVVNGLMIYSWSFLYLLPLALSAPSGGRALRRIPPKLCAALSLAVIFCNAVSCNQMAVKRDLELSATHSAFTRILGRLEARADYEPGVTPVVPVGMLPSSRLSMTRNGFEELSKLQGMRYTYAASYETSQYWYLTMILGARINLVPHEDRIRLIRAHPETDGMPRYPEEGSVALIDGALFIRF